MTSHTFFPVGDPAALIERSTSFTRGAAQILERAPFVGALRAASAHPRGVVYVGLDRFRGVNALLGQERGDAVLDVIEQRISAAFDDRVVLTRVRGSDFAVLMPDCADRSTVRAAASRLRDRLTGWLRIEGDRVAVTVTAGVAWSDDDGSIDLLEEAYLSSRQEKSQRAVTSEHTPLDEGILLDELRRAIEQDELRLLYQPQIDARSGLLLCAEALVRWQHPVRGLLDPHVFLPLAEDSGLMEPLGDWVIDRGARMARTWLDAYGGRGIPVVVNLSASQVGQGQRIALVLGAALKRYALDGPSLVAEITESSLVTDLPGAARTLGAIRTLGIEVALDDFGTGYSSLSYLRQLPVSTVKIDRSFVTGVGGSLADPVIIEAVTRLSHTLGLRVVAEGVEELAQAEALIDLDIDELQGFYFARPLDAGAFDTATVGGIWWGRAPPRNATGPNDDEIGAVPMPGGPRGRPLMTRAVDGLARRSEGASFLAANGVDGSMKSRRRERLQKLALDIAQRGLDLGPSSFIAELSGTLAEITAELKVDIVYVDSFDLASGRAVEVGAFLRPGLVDGGADSPDLSRMPIWIDAISNTNVLVVRDTHLENAPWEREKAEVFDTVSRAMISVPLRVSGRLLGAMSVEMIDHPRQWDDDEIGFVRQVAQVIANLLEMGRIHEERDRSRAQLSAVVEHSFDAMAMLDPSGLITYVNRAGGELIGMAAHELVGRSLVEFIEPEDASVATDMFERSVDGTALGLLRVRRVSDSVVWLEASVTRLVDGQVDGFVVNGRDVTGRVLADAALARRAGFDELAAGVAQRALDLGPAAFVERLTDVTSALGRMLRTQQCYVDVVEDGYLGNIANWSAPGQPASTFLVGPTLLDSLPAWRDRLLGLRPLVVDDTSSPDYLQSGGHTGADGTSTAYIACPLTAHGLLCGVLGVSMTGGARTWDHDETALVQALAATMGNVLQWHRADRLLRESEERLQRQVRIDGLTGLANRLALRETLDAIEHDERGHHPITIMVIDLDQFKEANDRHGHDVGDDLLCGLAARFAAVVPESALLARTGGDEFVVIAPGLDELAIKVLADQIVAAASAAVEVGGHQFFVGASVGIVTVPPDGGPLRDALRLADHAMYEAKRLGGSRWQFTGGRQDDGDDEADQRARSTAVRLLT